MRECDQKILFSKSGKSKRYSCAIYKRYVKSECSRHSITLKQIKQIVLMSIQRNAALSSEGKDRFVEQMLNASSSKKCGAFRSEERNGKADRTKTGVSQNISDP